MGNGEPSELSCRLLDPRFGRGRSVFICVVPAIRVHVAPGEERAEVDSSRWPYKYFTNCQARPRQRLAFSPNWKLCYPHVRTLAILWSPTHRSSSMDRRTAKNEKIRRREESEQQKVRMQCNPWRSSHGVEEGSTEDRTRGRGNQRREKGDMEARKKVHGFLAPPPENGAAGAPPLRMGKSRGDSGWWAGPG